jgi:hypothetical protein
MSYGYSPSYPPTRYDYGYAEPTRRSAPASVHLVAIMQYLGGLVLLVIGAVAAAFALGGDTNALFGLVVPVLYVVLLSMPAARSWFRSHTY